MASVVFGGMALAAYFSVSRLACSADGETHRHAHQSPSTWLEALYLFAEALRYVTWQQYRTMSWLCTSTQLMNRYLGSSVTHVYMRKQISRFEKGEVLVLFRYTFRETFGKWRTGDLLLGLAYLARRDLASTKHIDAYEPHRVIHKGNISDEELRGKMVSCFVE
jgi:hypothetical protein